MYSADGPGRCFREFGAVNNSIVNIFVSGPLCRRARTSPPPPTPLSLLLSLPSLLGTAKLSPLSRLGIFREGWRAERALVSAPSWWPSLASSVRGLLDLVWIIHAEG